MTDTIINSRAWWDDNFSSAWESNSGREQTRHFMERFIANLPEPETEFLQTTIATVLDWGCALGDGTNVLAQAFPTCRVTGLDFSQVAVEKARLAFPHLEFITTEGGEIAEAVDVMVCSNCLEHFDAPLDVLRSQISQCRLVYAALVPLDEKVLCESHRSRFDADSFPTQVNGFWRLCRRPVEVDARLWDGNQLLVVYGSPEYCKGRSSRLERFAERLRAELNTLQASRMVQGVTAINRMLGRLQSAVGVEALAGRLKSRAEKRRERRRIMANLRQVDSRQMDAGNRTLSAARDTRRTSGTAQGASDTPGRSRNVPRDFFAKRLALLKSFCDTIRHQGIGYAFVLSSRYLRRNTSTRRSVVFSNEDRYTHEQSAQSAYLNAYLSGESDPTHSDCLTAFFSTRLAQDTRTLIYPLSYPLELTQRPDHVLRSFAENGYCCIIITVDDAPPFVRELSSGIYLTNLFAATISHYADKHVCLYVTYPFHNYVSHCLRKAAVIYDVLDDLSVFSLNCETMRRDHATLLANADIVMFASQALLDANSKRVHHRSYLVTNGVWVADFSPDNADLAQYEIPRHAGEVILGYHGVISDLLDWRLLEALIAIPKVRLVLLGPVATFADSQDSTDREVQQRVMASPQVTHIPTVPYKRLKYYLAQFDAGIIPFVVSDKTNPVSPLKLFEYMAMGLRIFATPTKTLSEYSAHIMVADRSELPGLLRGLLAKGSVRNRCDYAATLRKADWGRQLNPVRESVDLLLGDRLRVRSKARRVDILNVTFFDADGTIRYKGGAERYVYDLARLFKVAGWSSRIIQHANRPFHLDFMGIPVVGVPTGRENDMRGMSKGFGDIVKGADLIVASPLDLACELRGVPVIGINHGIYWDHKYKSLSTANIEEYRNIFDALGMVGSCVCVDTNFMNWVRTYDYQLGKKLRYVPNYFDASEFYPVEKNFAGRIRALYPRRLYEPRGCFITLQAFDYLLKKYRDLDLHLVGQATHEDSLLVSEFIEKFPGRVIWEELEMQDMPRVYGTSHVVLIPTMYSEGTSLSCLEGIATNNAIVASHVGGLPNLVIDGFNGLLIDPNVHALVRAMETLLRDRAGMSAMAKAGLHLAPVFEKAKWTEHWRSLINKCVNG